MAPRSATPTWGFYRSIITVVGLAVLPLFFSAAFHVPSRSLAPARHRHGTSLLRYSENDDLDKLREEIEQLRKEAQKRLEDVSHKADDVLSHIPASTTATATDVESPLVSLRGEKSSVSKPSIVSNPSDQEDFSDGKKEEKADAPVGLIDLSDTVHASDAALEGTYWKICLNIGREEGTWMPETWGVSGTRLLLQLQVQFRPDPLQEREDFLGGKSGAKIVHVVQNDATFGPSMSESAKHVRFKDGGWKIGKSEGPMGTDLLRFYVEVAESVERNDVYCPAGRIYCTCGFFDIIHRGHSRKRDIQKKLDDLANEHNNILDGLKEEGPFSLKRMKIWGELSKKKMEIEETKRQMEKIQVMEPDLNLLRLSRKRDIGVTKDGGVCCKVNKGAPGFYEYHILGRFDAASVEHGNEVIE